MSIRATNLAKSGWLFSQALSPAFSLAPALALTLTMALVLGGCAGDEASPSISGCGLDPAKLGTFIDVPAGSFTKGADDRYQEERPAVKLRMLGFRLQRHEVTNTQFGAFVAATGYETLAERSLRSTASDAGSAVFTATEGVLNPQPWALIKGATWRTPEGPDSSIEARGNHPVVHIALADAQAYAAWAGGRLPTEAEFEYAAGLGLPDALRDTSGAYADDGRPRANTWQGLFPLSNTLADGFAGTAPVGCFAADQLGFHDLIGNVWEWTDSPYGEGTNAIKGGSFLCAQSYCKRYRPAARQGQEVDFSSNHIGFRIVQDAR